MTPADSAGPDDFADLRQPFDGICWWCRDAEATTGEHKFKRTDLDRLMDGGELIWGDGEGQVRTFRGRGALKRDRYGVIKFPKSLCQRCNSTRSQRFDRAYATVAPHLGRTAAWMMPHLNLYKVYGDEWQSSALDLARYYVKHFGCRFVRVGIPVPPTFRAFLNGADDLPDAHLGLADGVKSAGAAGGSALDGFLGHLQIDWHGQDVVRQEA